MKTVFSLLLVCGLAVFGKTQVRNIYSPDKQIKFEFRVVKGKPQYSIDYGKQKLIADSKLGLMFEHNDFFGDAIKAGSFQVTSEVEEYSMPVGKASLVRDAYTQAIIPLKEQDGRKRLVNFHVRIFNDGVAFRYEFPGQDNWSNYTLTDENTTFNLQGDPTCRVAFLENFNTSHEHRYDVMPLSRIADDTLMDMPALFTFPNNIYLAITEAALRNYAGMSLIKREGMLTSQLSPLPGQQKVKVTADLPHRTPWRVMLISDRVGTLIESTIITSLNEPCSEKDLSWLKPGKSTFHWWNGDVLPDTTFEAGINFAFNQYYIDFCAANNIEYHTIIGNRGVPWYQNDGIEYQPGPNTDVTKPRPGLDIKGICDYAKSKGVGIRFWVHWQALYPRIDSAFALFEKWGISGMMVDFMDRDDQEMVNIQEEILKKALKHRLEIQFHGSAKPTGLNRTYPNESTREGTLNYEANKWGNLITPNDDIDIPFTRLLAGPADYHLGGFRAMPPSSFKVQFTKPHVLGTRCHMLAMYVVLENALSMVCDYPQAYEGQPGFEFLKEVPTAWDETVVAGAGIGEWITIARRKGDAWYFGTITNNEGRKVKISLDFLPPGAYVAEIYSDAPGVEKNPNLLTKSVNELSSPGDLTIDLAPGGGHVMRLKKKN